MVDSINNAAARPDEDSAEVFVMADLQEPEGRRYQFGRIWETGRSAKIVACIFIFSCLDAYFTILLTSRGAVELNPLMDFYLKEGPHLFIAVKVFLTCSALFIFFIYRKEAIRKLNIRISQFLPVISAIFILLLGWELYLFYQLLR